MGKDFKRVSISLKGDKYYNFEIEVSGGPGINFEIPKSDLGSLEKVSNWFEKYGITAFDIEKKETLSWESIKEFFNLQ